METTRINITKEGDVLHVEGTMSIADFRQLARDFRDDVGAPLVGQVSSQVNELAAKISK